PGGESGEVVVAIGVSGEIRLAGVISAVLVVVDEHAPGDELGLAGIDDLVGIGIIEDAAADGSGRRVAEQTDDDSGVRAVIIDEARDNNSPRVGLKRDAGGV